MPLLVRIGVGALFVIAGALKLGHPADLAAAITAYRLGLPPTMVAAIALALPPFEILLGIYLLAGLLLPLASGIAAAMIFLFTVIVASAVIRGLSASCGCFGPGDNSPATWLTVARDLCFLLPAVYLAWWSRVRVTGSESSASV